MIGTSHNPPASWAIPSLRYVADRRTGICQTSVAKVVHQGRLLYGPQCLQKHKALRKSKHKYVASQERKKGMNVRYGGRVGPLLLFSRITPAACITEAIPIGALLALWAVFRSAFRLKHGFHVGDALCKARSVCIKANELHDCPICRSAHYQIHLFYCGLV